MIFYKETVQPPAPHQPKLPDEPYLIDESGGIWRVTSMLNSDHNVIWVLQKWVKQDGGWWYNNSYYATQKEALQKLHDRINFRTEIVIK